MTQSAGVLMRLGQWLKSRRHPARWLTSDAPAAGPAHSRGLGVFRPWARQKHALAAIQRELHSLAELLGTLRDSFGSQSRRQEEISSCTHRLSELLESLPEAVQAQTQTLKAIGCQLQQESAQRNQLAQTLASLAEADASRQQILQTLSQHTQAVRQHQEAIVESLRQLSSAIADMGRSIDTSIRTIQQVRDNLQARDQQTHILIEKQSRRWAISLGVSLAMAGAALGVAIALALIIARR